MRHDFSKLRKRKFGIVIIVCLLCAVGIYFASHSGTSKKGGKGSFIPSVATYTVERQDMMKRISMFGETVPEASVDIAPKYAGKIVSVNVKLGDTVQEGDILLVQDTMDLDLSIKQNSAASRQSEAEQTEAESSYNSSYQKAQVDFNNANTNYNRYQALYSQGAVSKEALDSMYQQMMSAKSTLDNLQNQQMSGSVPAAIEGKRAAYEKSVYNVQGLEKQRSDLILRAPRSGMIGYRNAEVGAIATAGQKVLSVVDNSKIYIDCQISEQDIGAVKLGAVLPVKVDSLGNTYDGTVTYISPAMDSSTRSYIVRIALDTADGLIRGGMFARTQLNVLQRADTLFIPKDGLFEQNGKKSVYVVTAEDKIEARDVEVGLRNDESVEILSGLEAGDTVAVSNLARLKNGIKIEREENGGQGDEQ